MALTFVGDGLWGEGKGAPLDVAEFDQNFFELSLAITPQVERTDLETRKVRGVWYISTSVSLNDHGDAGVRNTAAWCDEQEGGGVIEFAPNTVYSFESNWAPEGKAIILRNGAVISPAVGVTVSFMQCVVYTESLVYSDGDGAVLVDKMIGLGLSQRVDDLSSAILYTRDYHTAGSSWTTALERAYTAANSAGGGKVVLSSSFTLDNTVFAPSYTITEGLHPGIVATIGNANVDAFECNGGVDSEFRRFRIVGSGATAGVERGIYVRGAAEGTKILSMDIEQIRYGVQVESTGGTLIEACRFADILGVDGQTGAYAVLCDGAEDVTIRDNRFLRVLRHAVYLSVGASRCNVVSNRFLNCNNGVIIVFSRGVSEAQPVCRGNRIIGNWIKNVVAPVDPDAGQIRRNGIECAGNFDDLVIAHNHVENAANYACMIVGDQEGTPSNILLQGNTFRVGPDGPFQAAVYVEGSNGTTGKIKRFRWDENAVGGGASFGLHIQNTDAPQIVGGSIAETTDWSMRLGVGCENAWIRGTRYDNGLGVADSVGTVEDKRRLVGSTGTVATGTTITHNLGVEPSEIFVEGQIPGDIITFSNRTATTFDVTITKHDGNDGTPQPISWEVVE